MNIADEWKSWTTVHKTLLAASAGLVATAAVLGYGAFRSQGASREAAARAQDTTAQVQALERQVAKPVPPPDLSAAGRAIPNEWEMARFFADLAVAAKTHQVSVTKVTPAQPPPEDRGAYTPPSSRPGSGAPESKGGQGSPPGQTSAPAPGAPSGQTPASPAPAAGGTAGTGGGSGQGSQGNGQSAGSQGSGQGAGSGSGSGPAKSRGATPPPAIPGLYTLDLTLEATGSGPNLLAFVDELQAMPRFVWIDDYTLDFSQQNQGSGGTSGPAGTAQAKLTLTFTLYAHAPWDAKAANETPWPFPIGPAGNPEAFGAP